MGGHDGPPPFHTYSKSRGAESPPVSRLPTSENCVAYDYPILPTQRPVSAAEIASPVWLCVSIIPYVMEEEV